MINLYISLIMFTSVLKYTNPQYLSLHHKTTISPPSCNSSGTTSVEHFFNLIFAEFHSHPPVCVCVQMCADTPTYCYPNGCLKRAVTRKETVPVPIGNQDITRPVTFLVPDGKDYLESFLHNYYAAEKVHSTAKPVELPLRNEIRRDPFKDRYKSFFKSYKKLPKVHLRYNLRDQVKNTRAEQIKEKSDVSNTRWPARVNERKQFFIDASENRENIDEHSKFKMTPSMSISPSRFFKRDLSKSKNVTAPTDEIIDETDSPLVLQNLIEYLIEGSFRPPGNYTELDFKLSLEYSKNNTTSKEETESPVVAAPKKRFTDLLNENLEILNETTNVISINFTNENTDQNKYTDDSVEMYKNVYNEMIETLSNTIERENNSSMEFMNKIVGTIDITTVITTPETASVLVYITTPDTATSYYDDTTTEDALQNLEILKSDITEVEIITETTKASDIAEVPNKVKSRQKITRKLQNSKVN